MKTLTLLLLAATQLMAADPIDLSGKYQLHLQSKGEILPPEQDDTTPPDELTFDDTIDLPGTTDLAKKGPRVTEDRPFEYHLSREYDHIGPAYYKRGITIPADWKDYEAVLFLERVMWQSRVWIDGKELSTPQDSLNTPHHHKLGKLTPGKHELVIRVDNRMVHPIGDKGHAYGAQTQSLWNGIVGRMEIRPIPENHIKSVRVFPELDGTVQVEINGALDGKLTTEVEDSANSSSVKDVDSTSLSLKVKEPTLWSEFSPKTYHLKVTLTDSTGKVLDSHSTSFGFRKVSRKGNQLLINDAPAFMRGNLECAGFPLTGHPPVTVEGWKKVWQVYKDHNLNHARFHSWCPPEAAFIAADEMGIYLQVEAPIWIDHWMTKPNPRKEMDTKGYPQGMGQTDRGTDRYAKAEIRRTIDTYGNHPSFVFFAIGNELGTSNFAETGRWMRDARKHDPRHLYAASTARTITPFCDFNATHAIPGIGKVRQRVELGTNWDYEAKYQKASVPIIAHEIGQWPVYVDWETELPKYTGPLKPYRLQNMAHEARENGIYQRAKKYRAASGATNRILYRYEIESFLRTPSCRGFQLLNMQDFPGQGEALVGWLDSFYETKGTTDPEDFRRYCAPSVPLLKLPGYVFKSTDKPEIEALFHHFAPEAIPGAQASWAVTVETPAKTITLLSQGILPTKDIPANQLSFLGSFSPDFSAIKSATEATLTLKVGEHSNRYKIWIYPSAPVPFKAPDVTFTNDWESEAKPALEKGRTVLLSAHLLGGKQAAKQAAWFPLYWSVPFFPGQSIETIGTWIDHDHPALQHFPTPAFADWNWHRICRGAHGFDLTEITPNNFAPIVEPVTDFHLNRRLGSIFEIQVGKGKLLVCGYDISPEKASKFPEVKQLRESLLRYAASSDFRPSASIASADLDALFESPDLKLHKLPAEFTNADLYVKAAGKLPVSGQSIDWKNGRDLILRQTEGVDYQVESDGLWRDDAGTAWHGKKISVTITPRSGVPGKLYVRFHDWNQNGRTGTVNFEGKPQKLGAHIEGTWLEFPVIREDTNDATLVLEATALTGPNLMITDIAFVPEE